MNIWYILAILVLVIAGVVGGLYYKGVIGPKKDVLGEEQPATTIGPSAPAPALVG